MSISVNCSAEVVWSNQYMVRDTTSWTQMKSFKLSLFSQCYFFLLLSFPFILLPFLSSSGTIIVIPTLFALLFLSPPLPVVCVLWVLCCSSKTKIEIIYKEKIYINTTTLNLTELDWTFRHWESGKLLWIEFRFFFLTKSLDMERENRR